MKLSEAILLGSMANEKCKHIFNNGQGGCCVMGAALSAIGKPALINEGWTSYYQRTGRTVEDTLGLTTTVYRMLVNFNNRTDMTRQEIAECVIANGLDTEIPGTSPNEKETYELRSEQGRGEDALHPAEAQYTGHNR